MSGRGKGVRRRTEKVIAGRGRTGERGMRAAVNPAPAVEPMARRRRKAAAETAPVRDPARTPVPGPEPEAATTAAPPPKRLRADESAGNGEIIDFCDIFSTADGIPRGHNVDEHEATFNANDNSCLSRINNFQSISILPRQANDDVSIHVPASLKLRICRGEYINLELLLKGPFELADYTNGSSVFVLNNGSLESRPKECKDVISSIERLSDAFIMFMDIYLSAQPQRLHELLHYFYTIR
ncbi:hypothetical protein DPMN_063837 [Dreissena polymorpha]|uniref:Uncharacterized protein n=1 Tax=Dreissena polymorpha TaxID=45954 RepID=A0A9D4CB95_DREPO|nr:hypothetical protein DPMN_063837 [Dreissena polymorpha]